MKKQTLCIVRYAVTSKNFNVAAKRQKTNKRRNIAITFLPSILNMFLVDTKTISETKMYMIAIFFLGFGRKIGPLYRYIDYWANIFRHLIARTMIMFEIVKS